MHLSERAIELPRLVILGAVLVCAVGFIAVFTLPKERTPRVKLPVIVVAVPNSGAAPDVNERNIVRKLEDDIAASINGLREAGGIISQATHGAAVFQIVFDHGTDVETAKQDIQTIVNRVKSEFPDQAQTDPGPIVNDIAFEDWPILQVVVAGGGDGDQRLRVAKDLEREIQSVPGVAGVDIFGGHEPQVQIEVDPYLMVHYGLGYTDLLLAVRRANEDIPTGEIETDQGASRRVRMKPKLADLEEIRQVPIGVYRGKPLTLADVATVRIGHEKITSMARYGGEDAVVLLARARTDIDVLAAVEAIQQRVDQFDPGDSSISLGTVRSQAREINYMLSQLGTSALYGTILVVVLLWIFLGWRNAGLIGISVPFAILVTGAMMWVVKKTIYPDMAINNMVLFALILVIGMVVDGCIIVGENIFRHRQMGTAPVEAAKRGVREVGPSLICAYLTTFAAFAPMFIVRGVMGDFLKLLPIVVLFALCAAMLVDHFLLPVMSLYMMKVRSKDLIASSRPNQALAQATTPEQMEIAAVQSTIARSKAAQAYGHMIRYALAHRLLILGVAVVVTLTPVVLYAVGAIGVEFFPDTDYAIIEVYYELPLGSSMQQKTSQVGRVIEQAVMRAVRPEEWYRPIPGGQPTKPVTTIGEPGALNIRLDAEHSTGPEYGMVYVELEMAGSRQRSLVQIRRAIKEAIPPMPDVIVDLRSPKEGPPVGSPIVIRVLGRDNTSLEALARRADQVEKLLRTIRGTFDVKSDFLLRPEFVVKPNRMQASLFGVTSEQIGTSINFALEGVDAGEVDFGGDDEIELRIRNQADDRDQFEDLTNLPLLGSTGKRVIIAQVADVKRTRSANIIRHYDQRRVINVRSQVHNGVLVEDVIAQLYKDLEPITADDANDAPIIEAGGETEIRNDAMDDLKIAMMISFAVMLILLVLKFNSFILPLIILSSVPLSFVGVALGLMICGFYFSVAAMIGIVALSGIVVNDAIVLVDFINRMRLAGLPVDQAVIYAGQLRLRPIFLTTVTTIGGLLPLALNVTGGGEFWQPLTVTIMFGLGFATLLQLFVVPLACYTFDRRRRVSIFDPMDRPELAGAAGSA